MQKLAPHPSSPFKWLSGLLAVIVTVQIQTGSVTTKSPIDFISNPINSRETDTVSTTHLKPDNLSQKDWPYHVFTRFNNLASADTGEAIGGGGRAPNVPNSGVEGTTSILVIGGVPGGQRARRPTRLEFAIAPIRDHKPEYEKALFVASNNQGHYKVPLSPGAYWVGPKAKALAPAHYLPTAVVLPERELLVTPGVFTHLDLTEMGYAP